MYIRIINLKNSNNEKILILTIALVSLFSCSSDENENIDPIIGTWYIYSFNGEQTDDCKRKSSATFSSNGDFASDFYELINNECKKGGSETGTWNNKGNNVYTVKSGTATNDATVTFSDNNNTFTAVSDNNTEIYKRR